MRTFLCNKSWVCRGQLEENHPAYTGISEAEIVENSCWLTLVESKEPIVWDVAKSIFGFAEVRGVIGLAFTACAVNP